jgi:hypothetical protein
LGLETFASLDKVLFYPSLRQFGTGRVGTYRLQGIVALVIPVDINEKIEFMVSKAMIVTRRIILRCKGVIETECFDNKRKLVLILVRDPKESCGKVQGRLDHAVPINDVMRDITKSDKEDSSGEGRCALGLAAKYGEGALFCEILK